MFESFQLQSTPPREGGDHHATAACSVVEDFNPRPPARGATYRVSTSAARMALQSTPPREGGDRSTLSYFRFLSPTSIHAPPRGGRPKIEDLRLQSGHFNPRPPARGATWFRRFPRSPLCKLQSTPPREGGDFVFLHDVRCIDTSIHAPPRGGRLLRNLYDRRYHSDFNPRPPARGATVKIGSSTLSQSTSIHAPPRGGRPRSTFHSLSRGSFNPRPPARGATIAVLPCFSASGLQSTPPREGGDCHAPYFGFAPPKLQSTPPREGGDARGRNPRASGSSFNPRPPARGATCPPLEIPQP